MKSLLYKASVLCPVSTVMVSGPPGCGKTTLALVLKEVRAGYWMVVAIYSLANWNIVLNHNLHF